MKHGSYCLKNKPLGSPGLRDTWERPWAPSLSEKRGAVRASTALSVGEPVAGAGGPRLGFRSVHPLPLAPGGDEGGAAAAQWAPGEEGGGRGAGHGQRDHDAHALPPAGDHHLHLSPGEPRPTCCPRVHSPGGG